jgi:hypothetical protein
LMLELTNLPTEPIIPTNRLGAETHEGEPLMENTQEELKAHLMQTDEGFRHLAEQHMQYHKLLEVIESKAFLTPEDEIEEHRLKKLKLHLRIR